MKNVDIYERIENCEDFINRFEKNIDVMLPEKYRDFLLKNNVCSLEYEKFSDCLGEPISSVKIMFGFYLEPESDDNFVYTLSWNYDIYHNRIHSDYLAIAGDYFGNRICIGLDGDKRGKIYFWDHEAEENQHNLILLADDFDSFLEGLHE